MESFQQVVDLFLHLDTTLNQGAASLGGWLYAILFCIVFCETGLVVTPFLPGDSLLFAIGALGSTKDSPINLPLMALILTAAAILGDTVNYSIGYRLGPQIFRRKTSWLLNKKHLQTSHDFYVRHGGKTIILGRFLPIIRTFAPFVAGMARMDYGRFILFNLIGAVAWVGSLVLAGYCFGQVPFVKDHFEMVVLGIIVLSALPAVVGYLRAKLEINRYGNPIELCSSPPVANAEMGKESDAA